MAIPGLQTKYEVRGKVRTGKKVNGYPRSVDYFLSDDPEFGALYNISEPRSLRIVLPHAEVDENFSTGMEWWVKSKQAKKSTLACYTKGDGTAFRKDQMLDPDDTVVGPKMGQDRLPIVCRFRECPQFGHNCKPMGRLIFFLDGGATDQVLEHDTKSWNSIERLTAALNGARIKGPLTGRVFHLSVAFQTKGANRFPVLSLKEVSVEVNTPEDARKADGLIAMDKVADQPANVQLAVYLDTTRDDDWRNNEEFIALIRERGPEAVVATLKARL